MEHREVRLHDGSTLTTYIDGAGPTVLLPVDPESVEGSQAEEMRRWGADPALGRTLVDGLRDAFRVVAFGYEAHVLRTPKPDTLTPENLARDLLAVADAAGADRFAYYGYSWLALTGLQLAIRTDRLTGLVIGGFPPLDGPYAPMLQVTMATHEMATGRRPAPVPSGEPQDEPDWSQAEMTLTEAQTRQFVTLYRALEGFDDRAAQPRLGCPRLCFAGSADEIVYDEHWGGVRVSIAEPVVRRRAELEALGWDVRVLEGSDHLQAMQANQVLPILRPWLQARADR